MRKRSIPAGQIMSQGQLLAPENQARAMPWWVVIMAVGLCVGALAYFTLYLPARRSNVVTVGDINVSLQARPEPSVGRGVQVDATITGAVDASTTADIAASMPTMGRMSADVIQSERLDSGHYHAVLSLSHGGLWQVQVVVHRPGVRDVTAFFSLNA